MKPTVARISELDPRRRRLHVVGEGHPGELAERGYERIGEEWVLDLQRPDRAGRDTDALVEEFRALRMMGYHFAEGEEWSPAELLRKLFPEDTLLGDR